MIEQVIYALGQTLNLLLICTRKIHLLIYVFHHTPSGGWNRNDSGIGVLVRNGFCWELTSGWRKAGPVTACCAPPAYDWYSRIIMIVHSSGREGPYSDDPAYLSITYLYTFCLDQEGSHSPLDLGIRSQASYMPNFGSTPFPALGFPYSPLSWEVEKQSNKQTRPIQNPSSGTELNEPTYRNRYRGSNPLLNGCLILA